MADNSVCLVERGAHRYRLPYQRWLDLWGITSTQAIFAVTLLLRTCLRFTSPVSLSANSTREGRTTTICAFVLSCCIHRCPGDLYGDKPLRSRTTAAPYRLYQHRSMWFLCPLSPKPSLFFAYILLFAPPATAACISCIYLLRGKTFPSHATRRRVL